jgi:hypothetical protein
VQEGTGLAPDAYRPARAGAHAAESPRRRPGLGRGWLTCCTQVDPQLIQLALGRSMYITEEERDADLLQELGPSLHRRMRVVVAGRQGFRVQPEDRAELGAIDAVVADESKQFHMFPE